MPTPTEVFTHSGGKRARAHEHLPTEIRHRAIAARTLARPWLKALRQGKLAGHAMHR